LNLKNLKKLTQKKYRREFGLCIIEGQNIVEEHKNSAIGVFERGRNINAKTFDAISSLDTSQGILAVVPIPKSTEVTFPYLVLDGVQDPGNMGAILRSAAAFGYNTVFCVNSTDVWSQKVLRSAVGTQFGLNVYELSFEKFSDIFQRKLNCGKLYIADLGGKWQTRPTGKFGLVLGSEGRGVSLEMKSLPHKIVTIKMKNNTNSLNVAVAGSIMLYGWSQ